MQPQPVGKVLAIAVRTAQRGPMKEVAEAAATPDAGLTGDITVTKDRGISLISATQWEQVTRELRADLPWHTRRANVLIDSDSLGALIGRTVRLGELLLHVTAETKPCALMDKLHQGLRQALVPDFRGGILARVIEGGRIRVGDQLSVATVA